MGRKQTKIDKDIETSLKEINNIESFVAGSIDSTDFNKLNKLIKNEPALKTINVFKDTERKEAQIISVSTENYNPYAEMISEKEFFKIVGFKNGKISARSGYYQRSLLSNYLKAKEEKDFGYIKDVLEKAMTLDNYLKYGRVLSRNRKFMKEWKQNISDCSPLESIKNSGNIRKINVIRNRII